MNYLDRLVQRATGGPAVLRPRLPTRFEPDATSVPGLPETQATDLVSPEHRHAATPTLPAPGTVERGPRQVPPPGTEQDTPNHSSASETAQGPAPHGTAAAPLLPGLPSRTVTPPFPLFRPRRDPAGDPESDTPPAAQPDPQRGPDPGNGGRSAGSAAVLPTTHSIAGPGPTADGPRADPADGDARVDEPGRDQAAPGTVPTMAPATIPAENRRPIAGPIAGPGAGPGVAAPQMDDDHRLPAVVPAVIVEIGTVEFRAPPAPAPPAAAPEPRRPAVSLSDYLARRGARRGP